MFMDVLFRTRLAWISKADCFSSWRGRFGVGWLERWRERRLRGELKVGDEGDVVCRCFVSISELVCFEAEERRV